MHASGAIVVVTRGYQIVSLPTVDYSITSGKLQEVIGNAYTNFSGILASIRVGNIL
jgi:hypothetical protein